MAKTNKHIILGLRKKISSMADEIMELRTELSKEEEKVFVLEKQISLVCLPCKNKLLYYSVSETLQGGGKRA